jgi:hypothetical protein
MAGNPSGQARGERLAANPTPLDVAAAAARVPQLRFPPCAACGEPIEKHGYARVSVATAIEQGKRHRQARSRGEPSPPLVPWTFLHADCDPGRTDTDAYFLSIKRARTARGLVVEILKLTGHGWSECTDWRRAVASILAASRTQAGGADAS